MKSVLAATRISVMPLENTFIKIHQTFITAMIISIFSCGCTLMNSNSMAVFGKKEPDYQTPRQVVPVWTDTVLHQAGQPATRGFGGRIMFYGQEKNKAIQVDGTLVVYAWDDSQETTERPPDRKYVFPADKLKSHYSPSQIGHSYSFWAPWDAAGGYRQHVTLITRFISRDGIEVTSTPASVLLQGRTPESESPVDAACPDLPDTGQTPATTPATAGVSGIELLNYQQAENAKVSNRSTRKPQNRRRSHHPGLKASEIGLTRGFQQRNMMGTPAENVPANHHPASNRELNASSDTSDRPENETGSPQISTGIERSGRPETSDVENEISDPAISNQSDSEQESTAPDLLSGHSLPSGHQVQTSRSVRPSGVHARTLPRRLTKPHSDRGSD